MTCQPFIVYANKRILPAAWIPPPEQLPRERQRNNLVGYAAL